MLAHIFVLFLTLTCSFAAFSISLKQIDSFSTSVSYFDGCVASTSPSWTTADFDSDILKCVSASSKIKDVDTAAAALLTSNRRFSSMGRLGILCLLPPGSQNTNNGNSSTNGGHQLCLHQVTFDRDEAERLHLESGSFRVDPASLAPALHGLAARSLIPLHGVIQSDGTMSLRDEPTRILSEAEALFVTGGSSRHVLHNGERLISFASAAERDASAASLNNVLWQPITASNSAVNKMRMARINPAHVPATLGRPLHSNSAVNKLGPNQVLIIFIDFLDQVGDAAFMSSCPSLIDNDVSNFYLANSWGMASMQATCTGRTLHLQQTTSHYANGVVYTDLPGDACALAKSENSSWDCSNYNNFAVVFPYVSSFVFAACGWVGSPGALVNDYFYWNVLAHELGHNWGSQHANSYQPEPNAGLFDALTPGGTEWEYGDNYDVMATCSSTQCHFGAFEKATKFTFLPSGSWITMDTDTMEIQTKLYPFDEPSLSPYTYSDHPFALQVPLDSQYVISSSYSLSEFWISARHQFYTNPGSIPQANFRGVFVHSRDTGSPGPPEKSIILDMHPNTWQSQDDAVLDEGFAFSYCDVPLHINMFEMAACDNPSSMDCYNVEVNRYGDGYWLTIWFEPSSSAWSSSASAFVGTVNSRVPLGIVIRTNHDPNALRYTWVADDGARGFFAGSAGLAPSHTWSTAGTHSITVRAASLYGDITQRTFAVQISSSSSSSAAAVSSLSAASSSDSASPRLHYLSTSTPSVDTPDPTTSSGSAADSSLAAAVADYVFSCTNLDPVIVPTPTPTTSPPTTTTLTPTTTSAPTTTRAPSTTLSPTTTRAPSTTLSPTTTITPTTTLTPSTTHLPSTADKPSSTDAPSSTEPPTPTNSSNSDSGSMSSSSSSASVQSSSSTFEAEPISLFIGVGAGVVGLSVIAAIIWVCCYRRTVCSNCKSKSKPKYHETQTSAPMSNCHLKALLDAPISRVVPPLRSSAYPHPHPCPPPVRPSSHYASPVRDSSH